MRTKACSVTFILAALAVLSCVFLVHATAAAATTTSSGYRRALLPREAATTVPTTAGEEAAGMAGGEGELPVADEAGSASAAVEDEMMRRMDMQTQDYPGSGANSRHDPRNPH